MQMAQSLGVDIAKISADGAQGGFQLTGSHTSWTGARPRSLTALLAAGKSAAPVIVINEIDKIVDTHYPVLPVLLNLLERGTAKQFRDEFSEMEIDASKIIFVLTANSTVGIPEPLLSRVEVFNVPRPEAKQRLRIIHGIETKLCQETGLQFTLDQPSSRSLAERREIDLRAVTSLVKDAFAKAIAANKTIAYPWVHEHLSKALNALETGQRMH